ncbi:MAG TPA: diguanylate cyclase [Chloroflexota bacterium]|nr:diguanylate cyclase [Chloroflexota bacterium]
MNERRVALTYLMIALLLVLTITTAAALAFINLQETAILGWTIAAAILLTAIARPFKGATALITVIGVVAYASAEVFRQLTLDGPEPNLGNLSTAFLTGSGIRPRDLSQTAVGVAFLAALGILGSLVGRRMHELEVRLQHDSAVISELTVRESLTGTVKLAYLETTLAGEIERARRYKRLFSLLMLGADDWHMVTRDRGQEGTRQAVSAIGSVLVKGLSCMDSVARYDESRYLVLLPETSFKAAQVVGDRLCKEIMSATSVRFRAGVAEFPSDAISRNELVGEAEAALEFARSADITVASRAILA